jgi:hypothetical protein
VNITRCIVLPLLLSLAQLAAGGTVATVSDTCTPEERLSANSVKPDIFMTRDKPFATQDLVIRQLGGRSLGRPCKLETVIHPRNDAAGPSVGTTESTDNLSPAETVARLNSFYQWFINTSVVGQAGAFPALQCSPGLCQLPATLRGGSGFLIAEGRSGSSDSSGTYELLETSTPAPDAANLSIPFVVMSAGDDDWLEFSNWGAVFWKAPVTDFVPNQLYFAVVPSSAIRPAVNVWGFFLNTTAPANTGIYIPRIAPPLTAPTTGAR